MMSISDQDFRTLAELLGRCGTVCRTHAATPRQANDARLMIRLSKKFQRRLDRINQKKQNNND